MPRVYDYTLADDDCFPPNGNRVGMKHPKQKLDDSGMGSQHRRYEKNKPGNAARAIGVAKRTVFSME